MVICQIMNGESPQWCEHRESGGKRCEEMRGHPDGQHRYGLHTIAHERMGNGHSCRTVEQAIANGDWATRTKYIVVGSY